jgi:hypothetical protein
LGKYVSDVGAIPVFSQKQWGRYFAQVNWIVESVQGDNVKLSGDYSVARVDLFELLERVYAKHGPFVDIGLNPLCHRFRQGWFFKDHDRWMLQTISGIWQLSRDKATLRTDVQPLKGHLGMELDSSFDVSGLSTAITTPLKRFTGADRTPLSDDDATALLESALSKTFEANFIKGNASVPVDAFVIDAFDKVTGDLFAVSTFDTESQDLGVLVFPDVIAAVAYLMHEILPHDEQVRVHGYRLCHGGGAPGSQDPDRESRITLGASAVDCWYTDVNI